MSESGRLLCGDSRYGERSGGRRVDILPRLRRMFKFTGTQPVVLGQQTFGSPDFVVKVGDTEVTIGSTKNT